LIASVIQILTNAGQSLSNQIKANTPKATGKMANSVGYEVKATNTEVGLKITAAPFFRVVETGRGPTRENYERGETTLLEAIKQWTKAKGIDEGLAYAITKKIHKEGTKLYKAGGRKDVFSNVITDRAIQKLENSVLDALAEHYLQDFIKNLQENKLTN